MHDTKRIRGEDLTAAWAEEGGFREPVIAPDKTGMGLKVRPVGHGSDRRAAVFVSVNGVHAKGRLKGRAFESRGERG